MREQQNAKAEIVKASIVPYIKATLNVYMKIVLYNMSMCITLWNINMTFCSSGAGNAQTSKAEAEGESVPRHQQVMYKGDNFVLENRGFSVMCNLTLFDQLKWTHNGNPIVAGEGG